MTLKPILIGEMFRNLMEFIELLRREIDPALAGDEQLRRDQQLLHDKYGNKIGISVKLI